MSLQVENMTLLILCACVQLCPMLVRSGVGLTCVSHLQCLHPIYRPMIPLFLDGMGIIVYTCPQDFSHFVEPACKGHQRLKIRACGLPLPLNSASFRVKWIDGVKDS